MYISLRGLQISNKLLLYWNKSINTDIYIYTYISSISKYMLLIGGIRIILSLE